MHRLFNAKDNTMASISIYLSTDRMASRDIDNGRFVKDVISPMNISIRKLSIFRVGRSLGFGRIPRLRILLILWKTRILITN